MPNNGFCQLETCGASHSSSNTPTCLFPELMMPVICTHAPPIAGFRHRRIYSLSLGVCQIAQGSSVAYVKILSPQPLHRTKRLAALPPPPPAYPSPLSNASWNAGETTAMSGLALHLKPIGLSAVGPVGPAPCQLVSSIVPTNG